MEHAWSVKATPEEIARFSLGFKNLVASIKWMETIAYFGDITHKVDYDQLMSNLKLITSLNPHAEAPYILAAILPWSTGSNRQSAALLAKAMQIMPDNWRWPYYRGFNAYWFDHDMATGAKYLARAARLPDSPVIIASLAAKMQSESDSLGAALIFLIDLANKSRDAKVKKQLEKQILKIRTEQVLQGVDSLLAGIAKNQRNVRHLHALGIRLPSALPDGGHVVFDTNGVPVSSREGKRFRVYIPAKRNK